jgi:hypothetical protein
LSNYQGHVVRRRIAQGSKSEREALMIETPDGAFLLRRRAGNPFADPELETLVGKAISARGILHGNSLIIDDWQIV